MHITQEKAVKLVEDIDPLFDDLADDLQDWRRDNQNSNYPDSLIVQCYKYALRQNACKFRGYILEGFPQSYTDAKDLFISIYIYIYCYIYIYIYSNPPKEEEASATTSTATTRIK